MNSYKGVCCLCLQNNQQLQQLSVNNGNFYKKLISFVPQLVRFLTVISYLKTCVYIYKYHIF